MISVIHSQFLFTVIEDLDEYALIKFSLEPGGTWVLDKQCRSLMVLNGSVILVTEEGSHTLKPGDSITMDKIKAKELLNPGMVPATLVGLRLKV